MSVLVPEPLDRADFDMSSCRASEAGINLLSSNCGSAENDGTGPSKEMRIGINSVRSLFSWSVRGQSGKKYDYENLTCRADVTSKLQDISELTAAHGPKQAALNLQLML